MRVPTTEQTVRADVPVVSEGQSPRVVPGAFGEREAQAIAGFGQDVQQVAQVIGNYAIRQNEFRKQQRNLDLETQLDTQITGLLTDRSEEYYTDANGKEQSRLSGYLNQYGRQAFQASQRFNDKVIPMMDELIKQQPDAQYRARLGERFRTIYNARYNSVITHEAEQTRVAERDTIKSFLVNQTNLFPSASPEDKKQIIADAHEAINSGYPRLWDEDQKNKLLREFDGNIVNSDIYADQSPQEGKSRVIEHLKMWPEGDYYFLSKDEQIDFLRQAQARVFQNNQTYKREAERDDVNFMIDTIGKISRNELTFNDTQDAITYARDRGNIKLAEALGSVYAQPKAYRPIDINNDTFIDVAQAIMEAPDQKTMAQNLLKAIGDKENISLDRLAILVDAARQHAKTVPVDKDNRAKGEGNILNSAWEAIKSTFKSLVDDQVTYDLMSNNMAVEYLSNALKGVAPHEALRKSQATYFRQRWPDIVKHPEGMVFINPRTMKKYLVTPDGDILDYRTETGLYNAGKVSQETKPTKTAEQRRKELLEKK